MKFNITDENVSSLTKIQENMESCPTCKSDEPVYVDYRASNNKMAVQLLDIFTKIWCIDTRVHDDLEFMCKECPFEIKDNGHCLVKEFKCKFYPEYKDFGSMGDL